MSRAQQDLETWKNWNDSGDGRHLSELLNSFNPMIQKTVGKFSSAPIPRSAIEAEAKKQAIHAFRTFDPQRKAQLNTHVGNYLQKVFRFVANNQNVARIPEHRVQKIQTYKNVFESLKADRDREPTVNELADELMWSPREVGRMQDELRKDLSSSESFEFDQSIDFDRTQETVNFAYYSLTRNQQLLYDYLTGSLGKPRLSLSEAAKKLNRDKKDVIKDRNEIVELIKSYSGGMI